MSFPPNLLDGVQQNLEQDGNRSKQHPIRGWSPSRSRGSLWCEPGYTADVFKENTRNHLEASAAATAGSGGDFGGGVEQQHKHWQEVTVDPVTITIRERWLKYGQITSSWLQNGCMADVFPLRNPPGERQSTALPALLASLLFCLA